MHPARFSYPSPGFNHYWNIGHGKRMLKKLTNVPSKDEIESHINLLCQSDEKADRVIKEVYEKFGFLQANKLIDSILQNGINNFPDAPLSIKELFNEVDQTPAWVNLELLNTGATFCRRAGFMGLMILRNYCLMGGYESSAINKPLIFTEALKKGAAKRMAETVEFWVDVTGENALQRLEVGFKSTIKVRLMHAYARVAILKIPQWENESWGVPINYWDMVATNLGFSIVFLDGLKKLGFNPTEKETEGVLHLWKYIGFLLGIPPAYLPDTETQAIESLYKWTITQPPADDDTKALALSLMNEPLTSSFPEYKWQKKLLIKLHLGYNHFLLGERACKAMELPNTIFRFYPYLVKFIKSIHEYFSLSSSKYYKATVKWGRKRQEETKKAFLKGHASSSYKHQ